MAKITQEMIHTVYSIAKEIYENEISQKEALEIIKFINGMNANSANGYIHNYRCMIEGRRFTRTNNADATDYYLKRIFQDGGEKKLRNALSALKQHIEYYESKRKIRLNKQRKVYKKHLANTLKVFPDEVTEDNMELLEGNTREVKINVYERNPIAREQCINHYGCECFVCSFSFELQYGEIGKSFIHVHHLVELSAIKKEYSIDPIKDLRPVCPNCHAMIHRKKPAFSIEEVKKYLTRQ